MNLHLLLLWIKISCMIYTPNYTSRSSHKFHSYGTFILDLHIHLRLTSNTIHVAYSQHSPGWQYLNISWIALPSQKSWDLSLFYKSDLLMNLGRPWWLESKNISKAQLLNTFTTSGYIKSCTYHFVRSWIYHLDCCHA